MYLPTADPLNFILLDCPAWTTTGSCKLRKRPSMTVQVMVLLHTAVYIYRMFLGMSFNPPCKLVHDGTSHASQARMHGITCQGQNFFLRPLLRCMRLCTKQLP